MKTDNNKISSVFLKLLKTPTVVNNFKYTFLNVEWVEDRFIFTVDVTKSEPRFSYVSDSLKRSILEIIHSKLSQYFDMKLVCSLKVTVNSEKQDEVYIDPIDRKNILNYINDTYERIDLVLPDLGKVFLYCTFHWSPEKYNMEVNDNLVFNFGINVEKLVANNKTISITNNMQRKELEEDIISAFYKRSFGMDVADSCYEIVGEKLFGENSGGDFMISTLLDVNVIS